MGGSWGFLEKFSFMDHTLYCGCILSKSGAKSAQDLRSLSYYIYHFDKFSYHDFFEEEKIYFAAFYIKKFLKHYNLARNFGCLWKCKFSSATYLVFKKAASWIFHFQKNRRIKAGQNTKYDITYKDLKFSASLFNGAKKWLSRYIIYGCHD